MVKEPHKDRKDDEKVLGVAFDSPEAREATEQRRQGNFDNSRRQRGKSNPYADGNGD